MPKWTEYTSKDTLADNDEVMLYDATARANKRGLMSKFWDYVVDKMATAVIGKLETKNKTIIGALNTLNSDKIINTFLGNNFTKDFLLNGMGAYLLSISTVGNSSILNTYTAIVTTGEHKYNSGKIAWLSEATTYAKLTDGLTLRLIVPDSVWIQCAIMKI